MPEIAPKDLYYLMQDDASAPLILDVRTRGEWEASRVAGAVNVPITELSRKLLALALPKDASVVAICLSAHRSIPAVRLLQAHGVANVRQLQGGMRAWWKAGLPVEKRITSGNS